MSLLIVNLNDLFISKNYLYIFIIYILYYYFYILCFSCILSEKALAHGLIYNSRLTVKISFTEINNHMTGTCYYTHAPTEKWLWWSSIS